MNFCVRACIYSQCSLYISTCIYLIYSTSNSTSLARFFLVALCVDSLHFCNCTLLKIKGATYLRIYFWASFLQQYQIFYLDKNEYSLKLSKYTNYIKHIDRAGVGPSKLTIKQNRRSSGPRSAIKRHSSRDLSAPFE